MKQSVFPIFAVLAFVLCVQSPLAAGGRDAILAKQWTTIRQDRPDDVGEAKNALDARNLLQAGNPKSNLVLSIPLIQFDVSEFSKDSQIQSAKLRLRVYDPDGHRGERPSFRIFPVTSAWESSSVTWNTRPQWDETFAECLFDPKEQDGEYEEFDVTPLVKKWIDGSLENHGMAIVAESEKGNWTQILYHPRATLEIEH